MRKIFLILFSTLFVIGFSQNVSNPSNPNSLGNLPEITKPSPESFFRTEFGNVPVNEYRGAQNLSIPIYELKSGNIKVPISLNYTKIGVKVNDIPNDVGMNWVLETGGVINRTIKGIPDELASERKYFDSESELLNFDITDGTAGAAEINRLLTLKDQIDLEVDVFNFTYPGGSGRFYLDKNYIPVLITDDKGSKVEFNGNFNDNYQFLITDNIGNKYYFGGSAKEETANRSATGESSRCVTSFFLNKIVDIKSNVINYQYNIYEPKSYLAEKKQSELLLTFNSQCSSANYPSPNGINESIIWYKIKNPVVLNKIYSATEEIIFNRLPTNPGTSKLSDLQIFYKNRKVKEIIFSYKTQSFVGTEERFFLEKIENYSINGENKVKNDEYLLEYDDPLSLPKRLSYGVDYLGYYNGSTGNQNLIPNTTLFGITNRAGFNFIINGRADRTAKINFAKKGTLKSITYPTKGKTNFEYESNVSKKKSYTELPKIEVIFNGSHQGDLDILAAKTDTTAISFNVDLYTFNTDITTRRGQFFVEITDKNSNVIVHTKELNIAKDKDNYSQDFNFDLSDNVDYNISLRIGQNCKECGGTLTVNKFPFGFEETKDAGLRLKKQYDSDQDKFTNIKRYYYSFFRNINDVASLDDKFIPRFFRSSIVSFRDTGSNCGGMATNYYLDSTPNNLMSFSLINEGSFNLLAPSYHSVTISYGGDEFENGGEEKIYDNSNEKPSSILSAPLAVPNGFGNTGDGTAIIDFVSRYLNQKNEILDLYNGRLLQTKIFKRKGASLFVAKRIVNYYANSENKVIFNLVGSKVYDVDGMLLPPGVNAGNTLSNFMVGYFPITSYYSNLRKSVSKDFLEDVSIPMYVDDAYINGNDYNYKKIETTTNYFYTNPTHNRLTSQKIEFADKSLQETTYAYAHEKGNTDMIAANMVAIPLETEMKKYKDSLDVNPKTISKSGIDYATKTIGGKQLILPDLAYTFDLQTPTTATTEVKYNEYDDKGNILQYTLKPDSNGNGGIPTTIIWGYNNTQPIAKIEGATYAQVSGNITDIVNSSNADALTGTSASEQDLIGKLDVFRKIFPNYQITTYSYNPLIGVTSITPPSGIREYYIYDTANRLQSVKDINGKILKEYQYNYKP